MRLSHALLTAFEMLRDAALAAQAKELRVLLIPEGVALVNKRYSDEAGLAAIRATQLTAEVRSKLAAFTLPSSMTLADVVDQMQAAAARIGTLLSRRRELGGGDGPTAGDLLDAKRQLIAMLEHVFASFHRLEATLDGTARVYAKSLHDEWLQTVKAASVAADRRRAAAAPATPPTPAGSAPPP